MRRLIDVSGYILVALLFTVSLAVAARGNTVVPTEKPSQFMWQAADGTYTNLPGLHRGVKQVEPADRITPVQRTAPVRYWSAASPNLHRHSEDRGFSEDCRDVYVGNTSGRSGGVMVCGGETAEVREQRVIRKGHTTTTTDTVLTIDGREVFRVRGRSWTHDPGETEKLD